MFINIFFNLFELICNHLNLKNLKCFKRKRAIFSHSGVIKAQRFYFQ